MSASTERVAEARRFAREIRRHALHMVHRVNSSHIGSALSMADLLAVLYTDALRLDPARPEWGDRDRFILSKGHATCGVYAAVDGHDHARIAEALRAVPFEAGKPSVLIARTTKGKGVSYMENQVAWHYRAPNRDLLAQALEELEREDT